MTQANPDQKERGSAQEPVSEDKDAIIARLTLERDNARALLGAAYAAGYVQAEAGLPSHADRHVAAADALKAFRQEAYQDAANAAEDYCSDMPDLAGHGHSTGIRDAIMLRAEEALAPVSADNDTETPSL